MRWPQPPHPVLLMLLQAVMVWAQLTRQASAAFQLPPFLQTLSERTVSTGQVGDGDRIYSLPSAVINVPNIRRFTPKKKHLKPHKLMRRMRKNWDPFWMSVEQPEDPEGVLVKEAPADPTLVRAVDRLNFTLRAPDGLSRKIEGSVKQVLALWLLQRSTCFIRYQWEDLGILYWPRWVRQGFCQAGDSSSLPSSPTELHNSPPSMATSCSWPPGMHCVPAESRRIRILRWQCRHNKAFNNWNPRFRKGKRVKRRTVSAGRGEEVEASLKNHTVKGTGDEESNDTENWSRKPFKDRRRKLSMRCKWKKIPYPVTDDCFCSC